MGEVAISGLPGTHVVRWTNLVPAYLQEPIGPSPSTHAAAINNSGIVVGDWNSGIGENKAVWWDAAGNVSVLTGLPGSGSDWATDVNDSGVIVGQSQNHAVRWVNGGVQDLHPSGYATSAAHGINAAGDIVGSVEYPITGVFRAYRWLASGPQQELGVLPGQQHSVATRLNDKVVVGFSGDLVLANHAFSWTQGAGMTNAQLGKPNAIASDISGHGRIVGFRASMAVTRFGQTLDTLPNPWPGLRVRARATGVNLCGTVAGTITTVPSGVNRASRWSRSNCDS